MGAVDSYANLASVQANTRLFVSAHLANAVVNAYQVTVDVLFKSNVSPKLLNYRSDTPANSTAVACVRGEVWSDGTYVYFATANNEVKRATLSSF